MSALFFLALALQTPIEDGIKALDAGKPAEAEILFAKAVAADPKDFSAYFNLAFAQSIQNKDPEHFKCVVTGVIALDKGDGGFASILGVKMDEVYK